MIIAIILKKRKMDTKIKHELQKYYGKIINFSDNSLFHLFFNTFCFGNFRRF